MVVKKSDLENIVDIWPDIERYIDNQLKIKKRHLPVVSLPHWEQWDSIHQNGQIINKIEQVYREAGWKVERIQGYDQRDNASWDYLSFS